MEKEFSLFRELNQQQKTKDLNSSFSSLMKQASSLKDSKKSLISSALLEKVKEKELRMNKQTSVVG